MRTNNNFIKITLTITAILIYSFTFSFENQEEKTIQIKGRVVDINTQEPLVCAAVGIEHSNFATVTNSEGLFSIKVPESSSVSELQISYIGYKESKFDISGTENEVQTIKLEPEVINLSEVKVMPNDPVSLINGVLANKATNYSTEPNVMIAFHRETIKKNKSYVSLTEAVVEVYKQPYSSYKNDQVRILKGRKGTDTSKIDTLLFKLQGGALTNLMLDVVKDPYMILAKDIQNKYNYKVENITTIDGKLFYELSFEQKPEINEPLFLGKLFIQSETLAVSEIHFSLNTNNKEEASRIFIKKQPVGANVYPENVSYIVKYREQEGKWYFSYSKADLNFKVNWKKKLFNTNYNVLSEMAVTDRLKTDTEANANIGKINPGTIMSEEIKGFYDENFWGKYNVIEPEKSINLAIKKITDSMEKLNK